MRIIFLGTGAASPTPRRNVSGLAIRSLKHGYWWLFDCGEGTQHRLLRTSLGLPKLSNIFLTHLDGDHCFGLPGLLLSRALQGGDDALDLYGFRPLRGWIDATLAATSLGGSATVVLAAFVHAHGLPGLWLDLPSALALLVFALCLAGRVRRTGRLSLPELAGAQHGRRFRRVVAVLVVAAETAWFALLVRAAAPFLSSLLPVSEEVAVVGLAAVFVTYTTLGGQAAVAWTDGFQLVLVGVLGLLVPAVVVLLRTDGLTGLPVGSTAFPTGGAIDGVAVLGLVALVGLPSLVGGDIYGKTLSARDERAARQGALLAGAVKLVAAACVAVMALGARLLIAAPPGDDAVLATVLREVLPAPAAALAAVGFLAAMMSSADSVLLTGATVLDVDLLPAPGPGRAERRRVRAVLLALGLTGTLLAPALGSVVALMKWAYTVFAAGAPLPILLGFQRRVRVPEWAAVASLVVGGGVAVAAKLHGVARPEPVLFGLAASALCLAAGVVAARSSPS